MATSYLAPGVYIEEVPSQIKSIAGVGTNTVGFIGIVDDEIEIPTYLEDDVYQAQVLEAFNKVYGKDDDYSDAKINALVTNAQAQKTQATTAASAAKTQLTAAQAATTTARNTQSGLAADAAAAAVTAAATGVTTAQRAETQAQANLSAAETAVTAANKAVDDATALTKLSAAERVRTARTQAREAARASVQRYKLDKFRTDVPVGQAKLCTNFSEYQSRFGDWSAYPDDQLGGSSATVQLNGHQVLSHAVFDFFNNGGGRAFVARVRKDNWKDDLDAALSNFESIESISLVAFPGMSADKTVSSALVAHCELTKYRFAILDAPQNPVDKAGKFDAESLTFNSAQSVLPSRSKHAALYFPYIEVVDPALQLQQANIETMASKYKGLVFVPPSGAVAGVYARTDVQRGVFKAPANASVLGARNVQYYISRGVQEGLNPQGVNCIRTLNGDITIWGARTLGGDENNEWRYVNVRRTFLFLAKSIDAGTQWVVFEPNNPSLWGAVRRNVTAFLTTVWRDGALFGNTPDEAFYVKCDAENNPLDSREIGRLVIEVGVAIVRPAEFVIFRITQGATKVG